MLLITITLSNIDAGPSDFERVFRSYLTACVRACPEPIELTYLPCRSFTNEIVRMQSSSYEASHKCVLTLTVEPADPRFYSRFPTYQDVSIALAQETTPAGLAADPTAPPLIVSDLSLLTSILESLSKMKHQANGSSWKTKLLFSWCRNSAPTFVDRFALSMSDRSARAAYLSSTLEIANARKLAFGSQTLLGIWKLISSCLMRWLFLEGLSAWCSTFSFVGKSHVVMVVSGYIFAVSVWERTKVWFLQS
ncbi:hypothetical protein N7454_000985 [Penicillium verhagenii]|nr:hypothetical protein N7454_000985 [Penicillium verhagenii]